MGFDWKLVQYVVDLLSIRASHTVLDPFCGAGTTLVQCKKLGISAVGVDANPVCKLASQVKTRWHLQPEKLKRILQQIPYAAQRIEVAGVGGDAILQYLRDSGMIDRGWLSLHKATKVRAIGKAIEGMQVAPAYKDFFRLALMSAIVSRIADIKFGPEVYCLAQPKRTAVTASFLTVAEMMISDLEAIRDLGHSRVQTNAVLGDSRRLDALKGAINDRIDFVITSPPYPNEHDYTRSTRLELVMLGYIRGLSDLRALKRNMLRCNTKGLYKDDIDGIKARNYPIVEEIAQDLDRRANDRTDGFSRLYGKMVREYFGGMARHLEGVMRVLRRGGHCAYVVRDQQSLLGMHIDTPSIIAQIANSAPQGFSLEEVIEWKTIRGSTGVRVLSEKILIFGKPMR